MQLRKGFLLSLAKKKDEEEMAKAQEELRKVKEQQAEQILSQMEALGLSPQVLLELHQKKAECCSAAHSF